MRDRQTCIGCGKKSPETETNYTLISAQFGWRLTRYRNPEGIIVIEWRCPSCWREYKKTKGPDAPASISGPDSIGGRAADVSQTQRSAGAASSGTTPAAPPTPRVVPQPSPPPPAPAGRNGRPR